MKILPLCGLERRCAAGMKAVEDSAAEDSAACSDVSCSVCNAVEPPGDV